MNEGKPEIGSNTAAREDLESTATLIARIGEGEDSASDLLMRQYRPTLRRWIHGRLPARARHLADTDDLVQIALLKTFRKVKDFKPERDGATLPVCDERCRTRSETSCKQQSAGPGRISCASRWPGTPRLWRKPSAERLLGMENEIASTPRAGWAEALELDPESLVSGLRGIAGIASEFEDARMEAEADLDRLSREILAGKSDDLPVGQRRLRNLEAAEVG